MFFMFCTVTELTDSQNEIQQQRQHHMQHQHQGSGGGNAAHVPVGELEMAQNKINQSKKESAELREQLRALAGKQKLIPFSFQLPECIKEILYNRSQDLVGVMPLQH